MSRNPTFLTSLSENKEIAQMLRRLQIHFDWSIEDAIQNGGQHDRQQAVHEVNDSFSFHQQQNAS